MRCYCCNEELTDYEATLRIRSTDEFADICLKCLDGLQINTKGNPRLKNKRDFLHEELPADEPVINDLPLDIRSTDWSED